jgi:glycosidase
MQWSPETQAGFSPPGGEESWLPLGENYQTINVEEHLREKDSLLQLYRLLLKLRNSYSALQIGSYQPLSEFPPGCYCYLREHQGENLLICLNFNNEDVSLPAAYIQKSEILLSTRMDRKGLVRKDLTLRPLEGCILKL